MQLSNTVCETKSPSHQGFFPGVRAIAVSGSGRLVNRFISLTNALVIASIFRVWLVLVRYWDGLFTRDFTTTQGIRIILTTARFHPSLEGNFWMYGGITDCEANLVRRAADSIKAEVLHLYPRPNLTHRVLVMHLRGGDVFRENLVAAGMASPRAVSTLVRWHLIPIMRKFCS
jgi:hypothetical protein